MKRLFVQTPQRVCIYSALHHLLLLFPFFVSEELFVAGLHAHWFLQPFSLFCSGEHLVPEGGVLLETVSSLFLSGGLQFILSLLLPFELVHEVVLILVLHASAPHLVETLNSQVLTRDLCQDGLLFLGSRCSTLLPGANLVCLLFVLAF